MRVIAGEYGGRRLKSLPGDTTRPTTDKVKGAIFSRIGPYFDGGVCLDLFAGSGGLAIEAVSRGAEKAVCVDRHYGAIQVIQENIALTKESTKFEVLKMSADAALAQFIHEERIFDYVFLDPPYAQQKIEAQIKKMLAGKLISATGKIICEVDKKVILPEKIEEFVCVRRKTYGISEVVIYERGDEHDRT